MERFVVKKLIELILEALTNIGRKVAVKREKNNMYP